MKRWKDANRSYDEQAFWLVFILLYIFRTNVCSRLLSKIYVVMICLKHTWEASQLTRATALITWSEKCKLCFLFIFNHNQSKKNKLTLSIERMQTSKPNKAQNHTLLKFLDFEQNALPAILRHPHRIAAAFSARRPRTTLMVTVRTI